MIAAVEKFDTQELTGQKHCQSLQEAKSWRTLLSLGGLVNDTNLNEVQGKQSLQDEGMSRDVSNLFWCNNNLN